MEQLQPLIAESAQLLLIGMGTVFVILVMMIFLINLMSKWLPEEVIEIQAHEQRGTPTTQRPAADQNEIIAAISTAINSYRNKHKTK